VLSCGSPNETGALSAAELRPRRESTAVTPIRLTLIVCALAYSILLIPGTALAHRAKGQSLKRSTRTRAVRTVSANAFGVRAVSYAKRFLGVPYAWGGSSPSGFDCSGLVRFVYGHFGISLPHSSYADFGLGRFVRRSALRPGDLVFFNGLGHVGMYVGGGRFIEAPHSGARVQISSLAASGDYDGARRIVSGARRLLLGR
jgi:cell wall-associated NlpC family hydrolase